MIKWKFILFSLFFMFFCISIFSAGQDREIFGIKFPGKIIIEGKTLYLNGITSKKFIWVKIYAAAFYLEKPTNDPEEIIKSEQIKHFHFHYLTSKATAERIKEAMLERFTKHNPPELVEANLEKIIKYTSWYDKDIISGETTKTTYIPGKGLLLEVKGKVKGIIPGNEFAQMYYRFTFGPTADKSRKKEYLGLE